MELDALNQVSFGTSSIFFSIVHTVNPVAVSFRVVTGGKPVTVTSLRPNTGLPVV